jgi:hypothetical protein
MLRAGIIGLLLLTASSAHAATTLDMDFRGKMPGQWEVQGFTTAETTAEGLRIRTEKDGYLLREVAFDSNADTVRLWVAAPQPMEGLLLWHLRGTGNDQFVRMPFLIQPSDTYVTLQLLPSRYAEWKPGDIDAFGIALPAGAQITLGRIEVESRPMFERFAEAAKSAVTADEFRLYSINFLWGPLVVFNPTARAELYMQMPPYGWSVLRVVYALLAFAAIPIVLAIMMRWDKRSRLRASAVFAIAFVALWVAFDVRMSAEIVSYAATDWQTYVTRPVPERQLRGHGSIYAVLEQALPILQEDARYAAIINMQDPYEGILRYYSYPTIPLWPGEDLTGVRTFFVYGQPGYRVDDRHRLVSPDGAVLTASGSVVLEFDPTTFIFRTDQ